MKKIIVSAVALVSLSLVGVASAQTYYYPSTGACITLSRDLSYGSRGSDVSSLQTFLVAQNYPGSGSWMVTGYYGAATQAAVRIYQQTHNLSQTGSADAVTRASIASCGSTYVTQPYNYNYNYNFGTNTYPYQYQYQYGQYTYGTPTLTSLTPTSVAPGAVVTLYGSGFDLGSNNVYVNGVIAQGVSSSNGTTLSFTVPYGTSMGSVQVYVANTRGTSNSLTLYISNSGYPNYGSISISSLSQTSASQGASITIYGSGFDYSNNTVYVDGSALYNIPSYNGTSLSFTVPYTANGTVQVYVTNTRGTSNALTLSIVGGYNQCGVYPYNYGSCNTCNFGNCQNAPLTVTYLSPTSGAVGSSVTVYGTGFSATGNSVRFGQGVITGLNSTDGRAVSFIVPAQLSGFGSAPVTLGTYNVSVTNASGYTSNSLPFTVSSLGSTNAPTVSQVSGPTSLGQNVSGTWTIQVNNFSNTYLTTSVRWGDEGYYGASAIQPQTTYVQGLQTLTFSHVYNQAGTYTITFTVTNSFGQQSSASATVTVSGSGSSSVYLSSVTPTSGRVGTQIVLNGSGFTTYDNTVHFGVGGTQHLPSYNGTSIYFTIPQYLSPCDVNTSGSYCATYAQQVSPGTYQVYVTNTNGQTGQLTFTVTQ